jgi:hypothetical protein
MGPFSVEATRHSGLVHGNTLSVDEDFGSYCVSVTCINTHKSYVIKPKKHAGVNIPTQSAAIL